MKRTPPPQDAAAAAFDAPGAGAAAPAAATAWRERAAAVGARPHDPVQGLAQLQRLWGEDHHVGTLPAPDLAALAPYLQFVSLPAGRTPIEQDEAGDYMLIVLDGRVAVDRVQPWGAHARLGEARPGDMLGEMSLLDAGARFSACSTLTDCQLAVLDSAALQRMVDEQPRLALAVMSSMSRRLSLRQRQVSARLSALLARD